MYPRNIRFLAATAAWALGVVGTAPALAQTDYRFGLRDEQVRVLGQDSGDELGSSIAIGDVTGDTIGDLVIGARQGDGRTNARADAGEVVVVAGGPLIPVSIRAGAAQTVIFGPSESANLGDAVAVGDLNGDGIGDIIMGAAKADAPERGGAGTVFVIYGRTDLDRSIDLGEDTADVRLYGTQVDGALGRRIVVGDFDADGVEDVAFSAPREGRQFARANAGVVYVFFGKRGLERGIEVYPSTTGGLPTAVAVRGPTEDARLGHALAAGDVNGDGIDDIVMTAAVPAPFGRIDSGDVFVVFGGPRLVEGLTVDLAEPVQVDLKILGPQPGDHFGQGLGTADVNGDGVADLLIGAPTAPFVPAILTGRAYAIFGRPFQPHTVLDMATDGGDVSLVGPAMGAELGASLAGGDMNGDGFDEWIVGSPGADTTRAGVERVGDEPAGHAYRILGRAIWSDLGVMGALSQGVRPGDRAGDVLALGDVSGDGVPDLAVAAPLYDGLNDQAKDSGAAYVLFGRVGAETPLPNCSDADGDGFRVQGRTCGPLDCNDTRADTYPTADELCTDGIDNNCDGVVDQDGIDADEDGWPGGLEARCSVLDCNDSNPAINPGAGEICGDQVDNDCNGFTDAIDAVCALGSESCVNCVDDDGDGIGDLYEDACQAQPVEFKEVMARKAKSDLRMARKLYATGRIYDAPFMSDPNVATKSMVLGLAFSADRQVCLNMAGGRWKKKTLIFRGTGTGKTQVRFKRRKDGVVNFVLETQNGFVLPEVAPVNFSVGVFPGDAQYRGTTALQPKGTRALVR